jgi:hypothetical protein
VSEGARLSGARSPKLIATQIASIQIFHMQQFCFVFCKYCPLDLDALPAKPAHTPQSTAESMRRKWASV